MARLVDTLPRPESPRAKKFIILSFGRNGTLGLYKTFRQLGYRPYHFSECFDRGIAHVTLATEALRAKYFGEGKPFGREEFDKWFADYDTICDVSAFFAPELAAAYPDAKFILTHREPRSWVRSIHKTFVPLQKAQNQFPLWPMRCIEPYTYSFFQLTALITRILWRDLGIYEGPEADKALLRTYLEHNEVARKLAPPEKLLVVKLEDGLDWPQICPFIGEKVPETPYPRGNDPDEFGKMVQGQMMAHWKKSFAKLAIVAAPVVLLVAWVIRWHSARDFR